MPNKMYYLEPLNFEHDRVFKKARNRKVNKLEIRQLFTIKYFED